MRRVPSNTQRENLHSPHMLIRYFILPPLLFWFNNPTNSSELQRDLLELV